jgi:hypothetical protein
MPHAVPPQPSRRLAPAGTARRAGARLAAAGLALLLLGGLMPQAALGLEPERRVLSPVGPDTASVVAAPRPYRLNLANRRDFVAQTNFVQCVGASVQMMLNVVQPGSNRSAKTQKQLQQLARRWSGPRPDGTQRQGAGVTGWSAALNLRGGGPYRVVGADSLQEAMRIAATAIRTYRRPVGLLVWRGRHAWVMSGFKATADPALTDSFTVTGAYILDPLYPHGSKVWGPSPRPGTLVSVATVGRQFIRRRTGGPWNAQPGMAPLAGKYVLVIPFRYSWPGLH